MNSPTYEQRRRELEEYFDRTAVEAWQRLTSDAPVGRIRATVRAGRDRMRATILGYLPQDLRGQRVLDAGCGTGSLALEAARRGAHVVAIDLSPTLVSVARERLAGDAGPGRIELRVSDMLDPSLGSFDWVVAMDSLIHYAEADMVEVAASLARRASRGLTFTFAPRSPLLSAMHLVGRAFPRGNRAPDIQPISEARLVRGLLEHAQSPSFRVGRTEVVSRGFYTSQVLELLRP